MFGKLKKYSDNELVQMLGHKKNRADAAFTELYNRYESKVFAYCKYMIGDHDAASDVFQETFVRFYKKIKADEEHRNIGGYLMTIARNLCYNYKRDAKYAVPLELNEHNLNYSENYEDKELYDLLIASLDLLDEKYKEAFILRELDGLSYKEISNLCKISFTGAQSRVLRAKEKIIKILDPYLNDVKK